jgi:hypothetical protein
MLAEHDTPKLIALALTTETGEVWQWDAETNHITNNRDAFIYVSQEWNKPDRLTFSSSAPKNLINAGKTETITAAKNRRPEAIARDILNRLLESCREKYYTCQRATQQRELRQRNTAAMIETLKPFVDWTRTDHEKTCAEMSTTYFRGYPHAHIKIHYGEYIEIKTDNLTLDQSRRILAIITEAKPTQEEEETL